MSPTDGSATIGTQILSSGSQDLFENNLYRRSQLTAGGLSTLIAGIFVAVGLRFYFAFDDTSSAYIAWFLGIALGLGMWFMGWNTPNRVRLKPEGLELTMDRVGRSTRTLIPWANVRAGRPKGRGDVIQVEYESSNGGRDWILLEKRIVDSFPISPPVVGATAGPTARASIPRAR